MDTSNLSGEKILRSEAGRDESDYISPDETDMRVLIKEHAEAKYVAPSYADDYSSIADWDRRSLWNLANVHDPSVEYHAGYYYMYSTDASYGNAHEASDGHYLYRRSVDMVNWEFMGMAISGEPSWLLDSLNNIRRRYNLPPITTPSYGFWAPCVREVNGRYRMYYSVVFDNYIGSGEPTLTGAFDNTWTERAFIGLRESSDLSMNQWSDRGMVICSVSDKKYNAGVAGTGDGTDMPWYRSSQSYWEDSYFKYNAIDPSFLVTPGNEHWLIYGSWHSGIVALQLNPETGLPLKEFDSEDESTWGTRIYTRNTRSRWQGSEAPEVIYNDATGYYYMFLAYDALDIPYNTRVCRAAAVDGPYYDYFGNNVTENGGECFPIVTHPYRFNNHSGWVGISHCCLFRDEDSGEWIYSSQGRLPANTNGNPYSNAIMMGHVRKVRWTSDGWPVVMSERYAAVPDDVITDDDLTGTWEHIALNYQYGVQQESSKLTLSADGSVSGALSGSWSYDACRKMLTIGSYQLCVERELDWEIDPRQPTIVYAGLNENGISLWGKKSVAD